MLMMMLTVSPAAELGTCDIRTTKRATLNKALVTLRKVWGTINKNKSQQNPKFVPSRASSSMSSYNFNTNRSVLSKPSTKQESSHSKHHELSTKTSIKSIGKEVRQKSGRQQQIPSSSSSYVKGEGYAKAGLNGKQRNVISTLHAKVDTFKASRVDRMGM